MYAFFYGFGTGIVLSAMLGTVFFFLVQNSIDYGAKTSIFVSVGVILSDIVLIALSIFNATLIPKNGVAEMVVRAIGACFILGLGIANIVKKPRVAFGVPVPKSRWVLALKGFSLNFLNPGNFFSWLAVSALLANVLHFSLSRRIWFYGGALLAIFSMEMLISIGAVYLKKWISPALLRRLNLILGIIFVALSGVLLWPLMKKLF